MAGLSCVDAASRDQRTLRNRLNAEHELDTMRKGEMNNEVPPETGDQYSGAADAETTRHGNKPSRGAEIDKELQEDDEEPEPVDGVERALTGGIEGFEEHDGEAA